MVVNGLNKNSIHILLQLKLNTMICHIETIISVAQTVGTQRTVTWRMNNFALIHMIMQRKCQNVFGTMFG